MSPLTLSELRLMQADLACRAERLRQEWRTLPATGNRALSMGKQVRAYQDRADDYAAILKLVDGMTDKERLLALLKGFGITGFIPGEETIRLEAGEGGVMGHLGFFVDFCFDADGKFKAVGVWE
jgi:hypothetical protein